MKKIIKNSVCVLGLLLSTAIYAGENPINWTPCKNAPGFECGLLSVPMDYQNPDGAHIQLPVAIHRAQEGARKLGTIFTNFGGPWHDDITTLQNMFPSFTATVQNNYDVITFVPRGVAPNEIACHADDMSVIDKIQHDLNLTYVNSDNGAAAIFDGIVQQRRLCTYDELAKYASTKNTIQDIDLFRQALHVNQIDYLGYSYGTRLGLAYLLKYPKHVNKMLLDSAMAPNNDLAELANTWAFGSENVLHAFFQFCADATVEQCAFHETTAEAIEEKYQTLLNIARKSGGIPTSAVYSQRPFTAAMLENVMGLLVSIPNRYWPQLAQDLQQATIANNADGLMWFYVQVTNYDPVHDRYAPNYNAAFPAVIVKDYTVPEFCNNKSLWLATMQNLRQQYPLIGGVTTTTIASMACIQWPQASDPLLPTDLTPITDAAPTVLIVNDQYDARTPLSSAQALSKYLADLHVMNKLVEWKGVGHMSYATNAPKGGCIDTAVDQFFATGPGQLPETDVCDDKTNPFIEADNT
jgi:pimeloyl-ACP methyl ester carboxylesterase